MDAPDGFAYTFLGRELQFPQAAAQLRFNDSLLRIDSFRGRLFGGTLDARSTPDFLIASGSALSEHTAKLLELLADMLTQMPDYK